MGERPIAGALRLYVQPDLDLVVSINAGHYEPSRLRFVIQPAIFNRVVMPAVKDE